VPRNPLEAVHRAMGAFLVERAGTPTASRYGDVREEHAMARRAAGVLDLCSAGKIAVRGPERIRFLHGVLAQDLAAVAPGGGAYSLLLSRDGRVAGEMRVLALETHALLLTPSLARAKVKGLLDRRLAATDATIVDESAAHALLSVQGPAAAAVVGAALSLAVPRFADFDSQALATDAFGHVVVVGASRGGESGLDLLVGSDAAPALFERLLECARVVGGGPVGLDALDAMRIEAGISVYGADMDETTQPLEVDAIGRGLSLEKGCFLGREGVERMLAEGGPKRRLVGLLFKGGYPPVRGDALSRDGVPVGSVTSAAYSPMLDRPVALAMVSIHAATAGTTLATADGDAGLVAELPLWKRAA
jgi:aminomethyltransferase